MTNAEPEQPACTPYQREPLRLHNRFVKAAPPDPV